MFHVIEGAAQLQTPDGETIDLVGGGHLLLPGRVPGHLAYPLSVLEVIRDRLTSRIADQLSVLAGTGLFQHQPDPVQPPTAVDQAPRAPTQLVERSWG